MTSYNKPVMTAGYGVDGLRIWKKVGANAKRYYLYAGGVPVCELSGTGEVIAINSFGPTGLISRDEIVYNQTELHYFYTFDPLGNVCQIQNEDGGVIYKEGYDAYGSSIFGSDPNPTPFGYGGQAGYYTDNETGLILCSARYYDPSEGRWLTRDPIGYDGGLNVYAYCDGNPIGRLDPSGLAPEDDPFAEADASRRLMTNWSSAWNDADNEQRNRDLAQIGAADEACKAPIAREGLKWAATKTANMALDVATLGDAGVIADGIIACGKGVKTLLSTKVYIGILEDGTEVYVGITRQPLQLRKLQHWLNGRKLYDLVEIGRTYRRQAHNAEEALLSTNRYWKSAQNPLGNIIHSISPKAADYGERVRDGLAWLKSL